MTTEKSGCQFSLETIRTRGTNILCTFHICFQCDIDNICDLFEFIENCISETVRMEQFALVVKIKIKVPKTIED
jgi:hypothetical protein